MRRILFAAGCVLTLLVSSARSQDDMSKSNQKAFTFQGQISKKAKLDYLLFLPAGYDPKEEKLWPLILFLHGAGERGTNIAKVAVHGPPKIVKQRPNFPFIVVSPQCPSGEYWSNDSLLALLDELSANNRIDPTRVYLTGLSMGGFGTWALAATAPTRFAAIAPICGGGDIIGILLASPKNAAALKRLPIWAFHGAKDPVVKLAESERMVAAFKQIGNPQVKLTVYAEAQHDSWTETYNNQELYDWFMQHQLKRDASSSPRAARTR